MVSIPVQESNNKVDISLVNELLDWCYDNTFINKMRGTTTRNNLLHWASEKGLVKVVDHLLKSYKSSFKNDDKNSIGSDGETPLHKATRYGQSEVVKFLISKGADVNAKNTSGETPAQLLVTGSLKVKSKVQQNFVEVAKIFIENGLDINCKNSKGETLLYSMMVNMNYYDRNAEKVCIEIANVFIEKGALLNTRNNDGESVLHYLAKGITKYGTALKFGNDLTKFIIEKGENVNMVMENRQDTPLHLALTNYKHDFVKFLIQNGANLNALNSTGHTPLQIAITNNKDDLVKIFIENGANVNTFDSTGQTPLQLAIHKGKYEIAELLLAKGAVLSNQNNLISDRGYLQQAVSKGRLKICQLLISIGANIDLQDKEGNTPLLNAIKNIKKDSGHFDIVKMLLEKGASPNIANNEKNVPLHFANSKELVELLLNNGAKTDFKNNKDQTPKDLAFQNNVQEVVELLIQHETRAADKELNNCIICFNPKNGTFAFLPCGHAKTCEDCCKNILQSPTNSNSECPTCRQPVTIYTKIFI